MNNLRHSFFIRLYISIILTLVLSLSFTNLLSYFYQEQNRLKYFHQVSQLAFSYIKDNHHNLKYLDQSRIELPYPFNIEFSAKLASQFNSSNPCKNCQLITTINGNNYYELQEGERLVNLPIPSLNKTLIFYEKIDSERENEPFAEQFNTLEQDSETLIFIALILTTTLFLAITLFWPIKTLLKQIKSLVNTHQSFGQGNLKARADKHLPQPLNDLATSFNQMAQDIENNLLEKQIFAQAIPHEIRTPLSRIQLASGLIRKKALHYDDPTALTLLDDLDNYINDISDLTSQIVKFSKLSVQQNHQANALKLVELKPFITTRLERLKGTATQQISINITDNIGISLNPVYLQLITDNLIKNAIIHSKSKIHISASITHDIFSLNVEDDGDGIAKQHREEIFLPFARLDSSRNRNSGGIGLGLAIVKAAAQNISSETAGQIKVEQSSLGGANFCFSMRLKPH